MTDTASAAWPARVGRWACALTLGAAALLAHAVPVPLVTGPIPSDAPGTPGRNYPFHVTDVDLAGRGYVAEEYFFEGTGNRYDTPVPGPSSGPPLPTAKVVSSGHPFKSRLTVYRPADPARFNGTVFVEWANVSSRYDNPIWWQRNHDFLMREGYAFVSVAAQHYGVHGRPNGLGNWSPQRYGSLSIPDLDPAFEDRYFFDDQLSYDVFAQGMKAVREVPRIMGGMPVRHLIAGGLSRSAVHLGVYVNAIHPRDKVADGVLLMLQGGQVRTDLDIPVMKILSESEYERFEGSQIALRQPDGARFRTWWMSGTSHGDHQSGLASAVPRRRDLPNVAIWGNECRLPARSRVHAHHITAAAMDAMVKWVRSGTPPARSPLPQWTGGSVPHAVRDAYGNALGGIRIASFAVPTATSQGTNPGPCDNNGIHIPFDAATLASLYPSHQAYVRAVRRAAANDVRRGFLLRQDAAEIVADAQASLVGTGLACGPLCANVSHFQAHPSTAILRDHTQTYRFRGGAQLLAHLDRATRLLAEGYTAAARGDIAARADRFGQAAEAVRRYAAEVQAMPAQGRAAPETAALLGSFAGTLIDRIVAEAGRQP